jgi:hypothetical protein
MIRVGKKGREDSIRKELWARTETAHGFAQLLRNLERCIATHASELRATPFEQLVGCLVEVCRGHGHNIQSIPMT